LLIIFAGDYEKRKFIALLPTFVILQGELCATSVYIIPATMIPCCPSGYLGYKSRNPERKKPNRYDLSQFNSSYLPKPFFKVSSW